MLSQEGAQRRREMNNAAGTVPENRRRLKEKQRGLSEFYSRYGGYKISIACSDKMISAIMNQSRTD